MNKFLIILFFLTTISYSQIQNRYIDSTFSQSQIVTNEVYAIAPELNSPYTGESFTHSEELKFHMYAPTGDTHSKRPLLICAHGGGFVTGTKEHDDMIAFSKYFAKRGYVTATLQYRLGMNFLSTDSGERAVYRGLQDSRAAIRYFKHNSEVYGIDTNHIYFLGSSAGAFVGLHNIYMNKISEIPSSISSGGPDLGGFDEINPSLNYGSHPNGLISLWGAVKDTLLIEETESTIPVFLVHGTNDGTVGFDVAHPFGLSFLPKTYGSKTIDERLKSLGQNPMTYFVQGEDHEFYGVSNGTWSPAPNQYWNIVLTKVSDFLMGIHKPTADFSFVASNQIVTFTDKSLKAVGWQWDFGDGSTSTLQNPQHTYQQPGRYNVLLSIQSSVASWDTISAEVDISITGIDDDGNLITEYNLAQNYPNPFNPSTTISYSLPKGTNINITIYDVLGNEVAILVDEYKSAGKYKFEFNSSNLTSGIYLYTLSAGEFSEAKKMIILK